MAYRVKGTPVVLLNPSEKAKRYTRQLNNGCISETGKELSPTDKAWRAGYLAARSDSQKAFCHNNGIKSKAKPRSRKKK